MGKQRWRHRTHQRCRGEAGESLAELMVTISIMAIAVVTIVSSMAVAILLSSRHREQSTAGTLLVSAAEWVKDRVYDPACPAAGYASPPGATGFTVAASVAYLDDSGASVACDDTVHLQRVTVTVTSPTGYATHVDVVKRDQ
jgi:hypothetical protein